MKIGGELHSRRTLRFAPLFSNYQQLIIMAQIEAIETFTEILEDHLRNCENLGRYAEAEIAR